ncbi:MAG: efflux RND transporter periplasmic adaptor subunit [Flavobacteriales bacterium]
MKNKKWIWFGLGGIIFVLLIIALTRGSQNDRIGVDVELLESRDLVERVSASGKIQPEVEVNITAEVSGMITALEVKEGDLVEYGDFLVEINPDIYQSAENRAVAALNSAKSNLASAEAQEAQVEAQFYAAQKDWNRTRQLFDDRVISQAEFDAGEASFQTAEANLRSARAGVQAAEFGITSAQATLQEARDNLSRTTIFAPKTGTITALSKEIGESVQGTGMMAGEVIMKVSDLTTMEVNVEVNESDIVHVSVGDAAEIEVDAYLDETFPGVVTEIGNTALNATGGMMSADQVTNFGVKIRLVRSGYQHLLAEGDSLGSPFRPGMSATVDILTAEVKNTPSVPIQAVTSRNDTVGLFIFESEGDASSGRAVWTPVQTGIQDNLHISIEGEGWEAGTPIVIGPYDQVARKLNDGDGVERNLSEDEKDDQ